ncbi:MAG TPA: septum formation initiator family protein [Patescibacteria group bacterium]|nr:septum formation initiator family protein [bacterium]HRY56705.1 septum formation initiator family protein [Patescibacteria group bacterium]
MSSISRLKYILGIVFFTVLSVNTIKSALNVLKSKDRLDQVNNEVAVLEDEKKKIEEEIEFKKTDEYIEAKARNDLNLIKPGEKVYVVKTTEKDTAGNVLSETDTAASEKGLDKGNEEKKNENWYSWYRLFFDN